MKIMVIQGPNLNMLGKRNPNIYGIMSMDEIHTQMSHTAKEAGVEIEFFQSNFEGELIDKIQECAGEVDVIIINAGGYAHTSIAIADAIAAVKIPTIEVHISNIYAREEYRHKSYIAPVSAGSVAGFGPIGYHLALIAAIQMTNQIKAMIQAQQQNAQED